MSKINFPELRSGRSSDKTLLTDGGARSLADLEIETTSNKAVMKILKIPQALFFALAVLLQTDAFSQNCYEQMAQNPEIAPIVGKVAIKNDELRSFPFMVNAERVTNEQERKAIGVFVEERKKCETLLPPLPSELVGQRRAQITAIESGAAELYLGNITWGEFTKLRIKLNDSFLNALSQYNSYQQAQAQAQDDARRQAILGMYFNRPNFQSAPLTFNPIQIPKTTTSNCNWVGGQLNCITR